MEENLILSDALSVPVSLVARIIPRFHRLLIYKRDDRANRLDVYRFEFYNRNFQEVK